MLLLIIISIARLLIRLEPKQLPRVECAALLPGT